MILFVVRYFSDTRPPPDLAGMRGGGRCSTSDVVARRVTRYSRQARIVQPREIYRGEYTDTSE